MKGVTKRSNRKIDPLTLYPTLCKTKTNEGKRMRSKIEKPYQPAPRASVNPSAHALSLLASKSEPSKPNRYDLCAIIIQIHKVLGSSIQLKDPGRARKFALGAVREGRELHGRADQVVECGATEQIAHLAWGAADRDSDDGAGAA